LILLFVEVVVVKAGMLRTMEGQHVVVVVV
jgi:hypothetical protein